MHAPPWFAPCSAGFGFRLPENRIEERALSKLAELAALVKRCRKVVEGEGDLLDDWAHKPGVTAGRAGRCQDERRRLGDGPQSPKARVDEVVADVAKLEESRVSASPNAADRDVVTHTEDSLRQRSAWGPAALSENTLQLALDMTSNNAEAAARAARHVYDSCT
jgi:hypothetical protein